MALNLYNSLSRGLEEFRPQNEKEVTLYTCGPTVYNYAHIGNYRAYVFADILKRTLLLHGYTVNHTMNLTDIDDKTIRDSQKAGQSLKEFTEFYTEAFYADRDLLAILPADRYTKATEYVKEMIGIIETLLEKNYAYKTDDGSVYFKISADADYGKLARIDLGAEKTNAGGRIKNDEYDKDSAQDFALWKAWDAADGDVHWEAPFCEKGRPGWHIECSAMSMATLGETIDIHTGGMDNMFPHHENEIAQSESATGKEFVKYWLHNGWLLVDDKKMAKSAGNFYTLRDITERGYSPIAYRYLLLQTHYRTPVNFTWEALTAAETAYGRLSQTYKKLKTENAAQSSERYVALLKDALGDDMNTSLALAHLWELAKDQTLTDAVKKNTFDIFGKALGFNFDLLKNEQILDSELPEEIQTLLSQRKLAREQKNFTESDRLRDAISNMGYLVTDSQDGQQITKL